MEVAWPDAKRMAVRDQLQKLLKLKETTPRRVAHTVGALKAAAAAAFPSVHLLTFNVQRALAQSASSRGWDTIFALPPEALEELKALHRLVGKPEQIWEPLLLRISKRKLVLGPEALVPSTASQELPPGQTWTAYRVGPQVNCSEQPEPLRPGANMTANGLNSPVTVQ